MHFAANDGNVGKALEELEELVAWTMV